MLYLVTAKVVLPAKRSVWHEDGRAVCKGDLAAMRMPGEAEIEALAVQQQQAVWRVHQQYAYFPGIADRLTYIRRAGPRIVQAADRDGFIGRRQRTIAVDQHLYASLVQNRRQLRIVRPQIMVSHDRIFPVAGLDGSQSRCERLRIMRVPGNKIPA